MMSRSPNNVTLSVTDQNQFPKSPFCFALMLRTENFRPEGAVHFRLRAKTALISTSLETLL